MRNEPDMPLSLYLSTIRAVNKRNERLNSRDAQFLQYFLQNPVIHGYEIFSSQKEKIKSKPTDPGFHKKPNEKVYSQKVYRRLQKLQRLKLVEAINGDNSSNSQEHTSRTKYYALANGGIYYLIRNNRPLFLKFLRTLLENHGDKIIFRVLLYPYIERKTLLQFKDVGLMSETSSYLYDCSDATENALDSMISTSKSKIATEEVFIWHDVPGLDDNRLCHFLKNRFNIEWLEGASIWKTEDGDTIRIRNKGNSLAISLHDKEMSADLIMNGKKIFQFVAESVVKEKSTVVFIGAPVETIEEYAERILAASLKSLAQKFVINLVLRAIPSFPEFMALSKDPTFRRQLTDAMQELQTRYKEMTQTSNNNSSSSGQ
jgi:hypothetical protein